VAGQTVEVLAVLVVGRDAVAQASRAIELPIDGTRHAGSPVGAGRTTVVTFEAQLVGTVVIIAGVAETTLGGAVELPESCAVAGLALTGSSNAR
jgi:hypothetical protein